MTITGQHGAELEHGFPAENAALARRRTSAGRLVYILLVVAGHVAYFRSTAMGYGYPAYQEQLGDADVRLLGILNYVLAAMGSLYILLDGPFLLRALMGSPAILFGLLLIFLTIIEADDPIFALRMFVTVFFITLPMVAFAARYGVEKALDHFRSFCIGAIFLNVLYTAAFPGFAIMGGDAGFRGMFAHKNQFGPFMAIAFVALFPNGKQSAVDNLVATGACLIALASVVASRSASAWIMLIVAPVLYVGLRFVLLGKNRITRSVFVTTLAVFGITAIVFGYLYFFDTLLSMLGRDPTLTGRTKMWGFLLDDLWESPLFGHGFAAYSQPAAFMKYWSDFGWNAVSTHNSYLEFLLNGGFVLALYWGFILLRTARANLVRNRELSPADVVKQQIITIMVLLSAYSQASHFISGSFFWLALVISLFHDKYSAKRKTRRRQTFDLPDELPDAVRPTGPGLA